MRAIAENFCEALVISGMVREWSEATAAEKTRKVEGVQRPDGSPPAAAPDGAPRAAVERVEASLRAA
jgi:hypothetical protein